MRVSFNQNYKIKSRMINSTGRPISHFGTMVEKVQNTCEEQIYNHGKRNISILISIAMCTLASAIHSINEWTMEFNTNKELVTKYAPKEAKRISQILQHKQQAIAFRNAADSIKNAHNSENTEAAINLVKKTCPDKANLILRISDKEEQKELFRILAERIKNQKR